VTEHTYQKIHHLLVIEDKQGKRTVALEAATCSIGRDPNNSIVLNSKLVSHQHAILLRMTTPDTANYLFRLIDGNLQGKRSTNGLTVNGQKCFTHDLKHGDVIIFGGDVKARYYASSNLSDIKLLTSCEAEDISVFLSNLSSPFEAVTAPEAELESGEGVLVRLASFPELISNPILEINLAGTITYLNPAAVTQFPNIQQVKLQHPILAGLLAIIQNGKEKFFVREVEFDDQVFEQSVHHIPESGLIRSYVVDITERKQVEAALQQAHNELEIRVAQRTADLSKVNEQLRREIDERRRTEEALRSSVATNRALLNAIPDLMFRLTREGTFVNFKAAKDNDLPVAPSEFLGKNLYEILPPEVAQPAMDCVQRALQTGNVQVLEFQLDLNHNPQDYEARIVVSAENEVMAIVRDITERKRAEEDIRKTLEKEKELGELKSRFVTVASHEFRTPLAIILSSTELLEHYSHKWSEEKKLTHFQRTQAAVKHMTQLLNDVLLIGKVEAGKLEFNPAPLDLAQFCRDLIEEIQLSTTHSQSGCPSYNIAFCSQGQCTNPCMDEKLLRHILSNLLSNAIKYSPQGGAVHFDLVCNQGEVIFRVRDEGIGIPEADQAKLFDSFHRASNVGTISGTGLGLAIAKKSVDLHGGTIAVQSEVKAGTTFTVTLPLNRQV
jgi:PAS domain S-box-containing protein